MTDYTEIQSAQSVKVIGSDATGLETTPIQASASGEFLVADVLNVSGLDAIINLTTTPTELKVGASPLAVRKYCILEGLSNNIKWGFSNSTQSFDLFKSQLIMIPVGPNVHLWAKMTSSTGQIAFGENS